MGHTEPSAALTRRTLIKGVAVAGAATWMGGGLARAAAAATRPSTGDFARFRAIAPSSADRLEVPAGYDADVLISWGEEFGDGLEFGYNCDFSAFFPLRGPDGGAGRSGAAAGRSSEGLLFVSHEYVMPYFVSDWRSSRDGEWDPRVEPYRSIMRAEKAAVGASVLHVRRGSAGWEVVKGSPYGRRLSALGPRIAYDGPVAGSGLVPEEGVLGTLANCSGGHTPWGTVLSCEENYQSYGLKRRMPFAMGWLEEDSGDPDYFVGEPGRNALGEPATEKPYYGYVLELDPFTGEAVKHTALGRFHHENVALRIARDGRVVAYSGDDAPAADGMFFKFVSARPHRAGMSRAEGMRLLAEGQLYVARWAPSADDGAIDAGTGEWHPLDMRDPEALAFTTRWVEAEIVPGAGGDLTQFRVPRAEDCELVPGRPRDVLVALTSARGRPAPSRAYGVVRLLREDTEDPDGTTFRWRNLLEGGPDTELASPDNLAFSGPNDLWVVTDISASSLNRPGRGFEWHGNNAIFYVPLAGPNEGTAFRFANAPVDAELTGPTFVASQRTLFVNVQHPGEGTPLDAPLDPDAFTSWWPGGDRTQRSGTPGKPRPSLVAIRKR